MTSQGGEPSSGPSSVKSEGSLEGRLATLRQHNTALVKRAAADKAAKDAALAQVSEMPTKCCA